MPVTFPIWREENSFHRMKETVWSVYNNAEGGLTLKLKMHLDQKMSWMMMES